MTSRSLKLAFAVVRTWTRLYTWRMPSAARDARRLEIESDLWESQEDPEFVDQRGRALHALARLVAGVPDDLRWRAEHAVDQGALMMRRVILAVTAVIFLWGLSWLFVLNKADLLPMPPDPMQFISAPPLPPSDALEPPADSRR